MMKNLMNKSLLVVSILGMLSAPSCTQRQVGKATAVVAVGTAIGAAVIIDDANRKEGRYDRGPGYPGRHGDYGRHGGYGSHGDYGRHGGGYGRPDTVRVCREVRRCHDSYNRWGETVTSCRMVKECDNRRRYLMALNEGGFDAISNAISDKTVTEVVDIFEFAKAHDLSLESAELFAAALDDAKEGEFDKLNALGLDDKAIETLAMLKMPSDETIEALSENLDQYNVLTKGMIGRMLIKARKYQAELED